MDCGEFQFLVHAYVDDEFDERERVEIEMHLSQCESCREQVRHVALFRQTLKETYKPEAASDDLKGRLTAALFAQAEREAPEVAEELNPVLAPVEDLPVQVQQDIAPDLEASLSQTGPLATIDEAQTSAGSSSFSSRWGWVAAAAVVLLGSVFALNAGWDRSSISSELVAEGETSQELSPDFVRGAVVRGRLTGPTKISDLRPDKAMIVHQSVAWHRRNLPIEVTGPSNERIRYWFHGKVDFPVQLPRFDRSGRGDVNLLGARLSHLREKQAAYVVYEINGSKTSVMVFGSPSQRIRKVPTLKKRPLKGRGLYNANGYNVAIVENGGVTYSITSDMPREDMVQLVNAAFQSKP